MPIAPNSVPQEDTLIAPLLSALTTVAQQVQGLGTVYTRVPDASPENNSCLLAPKDVKVRDDETNAKLVLEVEVDLIHLFSRARLQDNLAQVFAALPAWLHVLTAWSNQQLGGLAQNMNLTDMRIAPYTHAQQQYLALVNTLTIRTIWNIDTTP